MTVVPSHRARPSAVGRSAHVLTHRTRRGLRVVLRGDLDLVTAGLLDRHRPCADDGGAPVEVDLSRVGFMDVAGLSAVLALAAPGQPLVLQGAAPGVALVVEAAARAGVLPPSVTWSAGVQRRDRHPG